MQKRWVGRKQQSNNCPKFKDYGNQYKNTFPLPKTALLQLPPFLLNNCPGRAPGQLQNEKEHAFSPGLLEGATKCTEFKAALLESK